MIGQPKDYSEMLKRIFWASLIVGIVCTLSLGYKSPEINKLLSLSSKEWNLGPVALPIIAVVIPFVITLISRMVTLHDLISDLFHIRERFDINHILLKLAEGVDFEVDQNMKLKFRKNRDVLMRDTFYKYAPNVDKAVINSQLVSTALDRWGWFWSFVEPSVIILISAILAWLLIDLKYSLWYIAFFIVFILLSFAFYLSCKRAAKYEVEDILNDNGRKTEIIRVFNAL